MFDNVLRIARAMERGVTTKVADAMVNLVFPNCSWGTATSAPPLKRFDDRSVVQMNVNYVVDGVLWDIVWAIDENGVCDIRCTRWIEDEG